MTKVSISIEERDLTDDDIDNGDRDEKFDLLINIDTEYDNQEIEYRVNLDKLVELGIAKKKITS